MNPGIYHAPVELQACLELEGKPYEVGGDDDLCAPEWREEAYPTWDRDSTRVISGPLGTRATFPGTRQSDWQTAKWYVSCHYHVVAFGCLPGRWMARIKR